MAGNTSRAKRVRRQRLRRERAREQRREGSSARPAAAATAIGADANVGADQLPALPASDPRPSPADPDGQPPAQVRVGCGQRIPGQQVSCGWCRKPITVGSRGPLPRFCSPSCRRQARGQQQRATQAEPSAPDGHDGDVDADTATGAHGHSGGRRRAPGQQVACGWCRQLITVGRRGPVPKWCSASCRHRAWEQERAARSGLSAVRVHDRYVTAVPTDAEGWIGQLGALTGQASYGGEGRLIADRDLDRLVEALVETLVAIQERRCRDWDLPYRPD